MSLLHKFYFLLKKIIFNHHHYNIIISYLYLIYILNVKINILIFYKQMHKYIFNQLNKIHF